MPDTDIHQLAREQGFAATYALDASLALDAPEGVLTLLLMVYPYDSWGEAAPGCARISTYYFAAQDAYLKAKDMIHRLNQMGESAQLCNEVRLKPLLSRLKDFTQGRNTLHYHKEYGSRFHMQVIGFAARFPMDEHVLRSKEEKPDMCSSCKICVQACPAKALSDAGFHRDKCLRQHMLRAVPVPEHLRALMENRLVGCDTCQQVCPYNATLPMREAVGESFSLDGLLKQETSTLAHLYDGIGRNMASPNRICAQACIAAGNSREEKYLPILHDLCHHPSPTVAEHAKWAVKNLSIESKGATT